MSNILNSVLLIALGVHLGLVVACIWRVWRGENHVDRLVSADVIGTLTLAILILMALILNDAIFIGAALGLAALSFIGTLALARYISVSNPISKAE